MEAIARGANLTMLLDRELLSELDPRLTLKKWMRTNSRSHLALAHAFMPPSSPRSKPPSSSTLHVARRRPCGMLRVRRWSGGAPSSIAAEFSASCAQLTKSELCLTSSTKHVPGGRHPIRMRKPSEQPRTGKPRRVQSMMATAWTSSSGPVTTDLSSGSSSMGLPSPCAASPGRPLPRDAREAGCERRCRGSMNSRMPTR
mmetsp:Transcript_99810/g.310913  ORF Transcript_99810/g.310913 Transcript_99810/m.310913 type:complete len:200 (+) Transcript_99810:68-667(+)